MHQQVSWQVELALKPGALDNFRSLTAAMIECTRHEPGIVHYERFISPDGMTVHIYERYVDSAAAVAHLHTFASQFGARFAGLIERRRFTVYDLPSPVLRQLLDAFGATYLDPLSGFSRDFSASRARDGFSP